MIRKNFLVACIAAVAIIEVAAHKLTEGNQNSNEDSSSHDQGQGQGQSPALIQTFIQSSNHTCTFAQDRNKAALPDFAAIEKGSQLYVDPDFTPDNSSIFWADRGEGKLQMQADQIIWKRASEQYKDHSLFGIHGIGPDDIRQGALGNCWFLSAASALAEFPGRLEKIFQNSGSDLNANGIYAINLYTLGVPHTVIIDDYLPLRKYGIGMTTMFAAVGHDKALWGPLLEKAFAKYHGNYEHTQYGNERNSIRTLTNAPSLMVYHYHKNAAYPATQQDIDKHWDLLQSTDLGANIMQTSGANGFNLVAGHAYTLLGVATLSNGQKLVKLRNPWSIEQFSGNWSRTSDLWTDALRAEVGEDLGNDGIFFMSHDDFYNSFTNVTLTYNTEGWHSSHFLMLDDKTLVPGDYWRCGATCTRHNMSLTSDVDQTVYVTAHSWDSRCLGTDCKDTPRKKSMVRVPDRYLTKAFNHDVGELPSFEMKAGETLSLESEWDFSSSKFAHDWSVVAWGDKGPITIKHNEGYKSMSLPVIYKEAKSPSAPAESEYSKALTLEMSEWRPPMIGKVCDGAIKYGYHEPTSDGQHEWLMVGNTCPDTLFIFSVWMKTEDWAGVEFYKRFDAQGKMIAHTTPVQCFVAYWHPDETTCEWLVGDPSLGGQPSAGYVQTKGSNGGRVHEKITWTVGKAY